jgi:hypothetical protein
MDTETTSPWMTLVKLVALRDSARRPNRIDRRNQYISQMAEAELAELVQMELA